MLLQLTKPDESGGLRRARFGKHFELDFQAHRLTRHGRLVRLERIPRDLLELLMQYQGEVVSREQIVDHIWGPSVFLDTDNSINGAIRKIRHALRDDAEEPEYIETVTGRGYRFIAPVSADLPQAETEHPPAAVEPAPLDPPPAVELDRSARESLPIARPSGRSDRFRLTRLAVFVVAGLAGIVVAWEIVSLKKIGLTARFVQPVVTDRAEPWSGLVADGSHIFYGERAGGQWNVAHAPLGIGPSTHLAVPFENTRILDISPDRSEFLIARFAAPSRDLPIWIWPVKGGDPRRVGTVHADTAIWHLDGRQILYARGSELRLVGRDGENDRLFLRTSGLAYALRWSPDGRRISYTVGKPESAEETLWEAAADGRNPSIRVAPFAAGERTCCGHWTTDGRYFIFTASKGRITNLWAIREGRFAQLFRKPEPVQLTNSAESVHGSLSVSPTRIFAFADGNRFEQAKYVADDQTTPLFPDLQILDLRFSPDFKNAVFQRRPDRSLWRSRADGSNRIRLVDAKYRAGQPRWSPDGRMIAIESAISGELRAYVVAAEGGEPRELLPGYAGTQSLPAWSPDGSIGLSLNHAAPATSSLPRGIHIIDGKTGAVSKLPGSEGLVGPLWSPDGRHIVAWKDDEILMRFDPARQSWVELARARTLSGVTWSPDSRSVFAQDVLEPGTPVFRLDVPDFRRQTVLNFAGLHQRGVQRVIFRGFAADGSFVVQLQRAGTLIYALDLDVP